MNVYCLKCDRKFVPGPMTVHIIGPDVEVTCPFCNYKYEGKLTSFVRDQIGGNRPSSAHDAAKMIQVAQFVELNSSDYYKKRGLRHGRKKVRDVRD